MFVTHAVLDARQGIRWGMSPAQVKQREDATLVEASDNDLYYTYIQPDVAIAVHYQFVENRLVEITRAPGQQYPSRADALTAIKALVGNYTQQHGLAAETTQPDWVELRWTTPDSVITVLVWHDRAQGFWSWLASSRDAAFSAPAHEPADENAGRV